MANTFTNVSNGRAVAQRALTILIDRFPWFNGAAAANFSDVPANKGDAITTHLATIAGAGTYSTTQGYVPTDRTLASYSVTLNTIAHQTVAINDDEKASSAINLIDRLASSAAYAVGKKVVDDMLALVTSAYSSTLSATSVTYSQIVDLAQELDKNLVSKANRYAVLSPANYATLIKDSTIIANAQRTGDVVQSGVAGVLAGVSVYDYTDISKATAATKGFAAQQEAFLFASRALEVPGNYPGSVENVTEPESGLTMQVREWFNPDLGTTNRSYILLYGVARGVTAGLVRLV